MIKRLYFLFTITLVLLQPGYVNAQYVDLLPAPSGGDSSTAEVPTYDANRYERRPRVRSEEPPAEKARKSPQSSPKRTRVIETRNKEIEVSNKNASAPEIPTTMPPEDNGVIENFRDAIIGGSERDLIDYKRQLRRNDVRRNYIDIGVSSLFVHNVSNSDYWFRNYVTNNPAAKFDLTIWFGPFLGFHFDYSSSLGGSVRNDPFSESRVKFSDQEMRAGLMSRSFASYEDDDSSLAFFVGYFEKQRHLPSDEESRTRLATRGLDLSIEGRRKADVGVYNIMGFSVRPLSWHEEVGTGADIKSGESNETFGVGAYFGREYRFSRRNRIFWKANWNYEKNQFNGTANVADPTNGVKPEGTTVENTTLMFEMGYIWGD